MALARGATVNVTYTFRDRDNNNSRTSVQLPSALTDADAETAALAVGAALQGASDAVLVAVSMSYDYLDTVALATQAPETADVERKGVFVFRADNPNIKSRIEVPSIKNTLVVDGSNVLNIADPLVIAVRDAVINSALGPGNSPVSVGGIDLTALAGTPHKTHRGSSKG